jgi:hypothetical protein
MHESELVAYDWLKKEGIKVKKNKYSPDFIGKDDTYEVKKLYGNKLIFYETQRANIEKYKPMILVVSNGKMIDSFRYGIKMVIPYDITWVDCKTSNIIRLTDDIENWLKTIDGNPHKALKIVKDNYISNKDVLDALDTTKEEIKNEIKALKTY